MPRLRAGDIFLTRGPGLLAGLIRWFQRSRREAPSAVNHTGLILSDASFHLACSIEALARVRVGRFYSFYHGSSSQIAIYRRRELTSEQEYQIAKRALRYKGKRYGLLKLPAHALGWLLGRTVTKRLLFLDAWPICSWVVEKAFAEIGESFGVAVDTLQPDDIHDWVVSHPDQWEEILPLSYV